VSGCGCEVGAGTELKAVSMLLKRQSEIVGATVSHRSLGDVKTAMLSIIQSQMDWQKALDDMFEACGVDTLMTVRGTIHFVPYLDGLTLVENRGEPWGLVLFCVL